MLPNMSPDLRENSGATVVRAVIKIYVYKSLSVTV